MRENKFRTWDKKEKVMIDNALEIKNIGLGEGSVLIDEEAQTGNELIWMQFIGQKDENGKEIFEGDIVLFKCNEDYTEETKGVIIYNEEECCFEIKGYVNFTSDGAEIYTIEVIGNKFENPELLEDKK